MIATLISRIIGLVYRRPLGEVLGAVGLGYYGYASNLYSILLLISSYSIPMAISKIISGKLAKGEYKNSRKIFKGALIYALVVGSIAALVAFFGGGILLPANQQNAVPALRMLAPAIFLSAILGVLRGYFQAHHNMTPTAVSQIFEQIMNAIVSIVAAWLLIKNFAPNGGTAESIYGSVGGTMGTLAGVITALVFMLFVYNINRPVIRKRCLSDRHKKEDSYRDVFIMIFTMMTPVILTTFINNAGSYADSYLYAGILGMKGISADSISAAYGEFSNYYMPIVNIPLALASASSSAMMPEVSGAYAVKQYDTANGQITKTIRMTMFICIPSTVGLTVLAFPIMGVLFPAASEIASKLLMTGAIYVIFASLCTVTGCALQAIGKQQIAMINAAIALGVNIAVLAIMLMVAPGMDIYAVMVANVIYAVAYCVLNAISIRKYLGFRNELKQTYAEPLMASAGMAVVAIAVYYALFALLRRPFIGLVVAIIAAIMAYLILYVLIGKVSEDELRRYPMGGMLVKALKIIKIYR